MVRRMTAVAVTAAVAMLAGCTSSGSGGGGQHPTSSTSTATGSAAPAAAQRWDDSVCAELDPAAVAKAAGTGLVDNRPTAAPQQRTVFSSLDSPAVDYCRMTLRDAGRRYQLNYGVSIATWSDAQWTAYTRKALHGAQPNPSFLSARTQHLPGGGDALVETGLLGTRGLLHVGNRVVAVTGRTQEPEQIAAELRLVRPLARRLHSGAATVTDPKCAMGNTAATAALGAAATIRRDARAGGRLTCGWATREAFVEVSAKAGTNNAQLLHAMPRALPEARAIRGVGKAAVYTDLDSEPQTLRVATAEHLVTVEGYGGRVGAQSLASVAKAVLPNY